MDCSVIYLSGRIKKAWEMRTRVISEQGVLEVYIGYIVFIHICTKLPKPTVISMKAYATKRIDEIMLACY